MTEPGTQADVERAAPFDAARMHSLLERLGLVPSPPSGHAYHGFISYSHEADTELAAALQKGLQRFAKPWYRARALRIFRDSASLSANPDLWDSIELALDSAEYYILLASPRAAASEWVGKEAARWCSTKSSSHLLIALTDGEIEWHDEAGEFDWARTTALPEQLRRAFKHEPRFIDLRWTRGRSLSLADPQFREAVADLAAPLHGKSKDELAGEEVMQQRRTIRIARAVAAGLLLLTVAAVVAAVLAVVARSQADHQRQLATSRALAAESLLSLGDDPQLGLLLAVQAAKVADTPEALDALRAALPDNHLLQSFQGASQRLASADWSPDGSLVATGLYTGGATVWNAASGRRVRQLPSTRGTPTTVQFDNTGTRVLVWGGGQAPRLWNVTGSSPPLSFRPTIETEVATLSADGKFVVAAAAAEIYVWDSHTGDLVQKFRGDLSTVFDVEITRDHALVATGSDYAAKVWSVRTGKLVQTLPGGKHVPIGSSTSDLAIDVARFSPDGTRLVTSAVEDVPGGGNAQSRIWNVKTGKPISRFLDGGNARWSAGGGYVVTTAGDGVTNIWNVNKDQLYQQLKSQTMAVGPAVFSPDTASGNLRYIATGSNLSNATVWNPITGLPTETLAGQSGSVTPVSFSVDAARILTYGSDGTARIWDSGVVLPEPSGAEVLQRQLANSVPNPEQTYLAADPVAPLIVPFATSATAPAIVKDARTGATVATLPGFGSSYFAFDEARTVMLVTAEPGVTPKPAAAQIRSVHGGGLIRTLSGPRSKAIGGALSSDGHLAAAVDNAGRIGVWEVSTGRPLHGFAGFRKGGGNTIAIKFSPDGKLVLAADPTGLTVVWDPLTGRVLNRIHGSVAGVASGAISPNDRYVVTVSNGSDDAHLYRVGEPGQVLELVGHSAGIFDATFNADGTLLATTSPISQNYDGDGTVRVWSTTDSHPLLTLPHGAGTRIEFSADDHSLVTNSAFPATTLSCVVCGGFDYLLRVARQRETRQLTPAERAQYLGQ
jgi:WD40 repeat protein